MYIVKQVALAVVVAAGMFMMPLMVSAVEAKTASIISDDFQDGDFTKNPAWQSEKPKDWRVASEPGKRANKLLHAVAKKGTGKIYVDFSGMEKVYDTVNKKGPEWRLTFRYSKQAGVGVYYSIIRIMLGTKEKPEGFALLAIDSKNFGKPGSKFIWRRDGRYGPKWGFDTPADPAGVRWFKVTLEWEESTSTLTGIWEDTVSGKKETHVWETDSFDDKGHNRLTISSPKQWYYDDIRLEVAPLAAGGKTK